MKEFLSNIHSTIINEFLDPLAALRQTHNININHVHQLRSDLLSVVAYLRSGVPGITEPWELQQQQQHQHPRNLQSEARITLLVAL